FFSHWILGIDIAQSMLIGAIIGSTDAAAVFAIFKDKSIEPRTAATLEIESASNDPMAIILTTVIIDYIQGNLANPVEFALQLGWQILAGLLVGYIIEKIAPYIINKAKLGNGGFYLGNIEYVYKQSIGRLAGWSFLLQYSILRRAHICINTGHYHGLGCY
ncbi:MAG: cation:proton antiporter, partial [Lutispora sp.]